MKKQLLIAIFLLLSVISEVPAGVTGPFVKIDPFYSITRCKKQNLWDLKEYKNKDGEKIYIDHNDRVVKVNSKDQVVTNNQLYFVSNENHQKLIKELSGFTISYKEDPYEETIKPNMNSSHYKNCYITADKVEDYNYRAALNAKENIFYEEMLQGLVDHRNIVKNSYAAAKTLMRKELDTIKNDINKEWSLWSFLERLINFFAIYKKHKQLDENCCKNHSITFLKYEENLEAIEQELQSFTDPENRIALSRSWMNDKDWKDLQSARSAYDQNYRQLSILNRWVTYKDLSNNASSM